MSSFYKIFLFVLCLFPLTSLVACGGGENDPVFNDNGVCVANCPDNGTDKDGFVADDNGGKDNPVPVDGVDIGEGWVPDQGEVEPYVCPDPNNLPEECVPKIAKEASCYDTGKYKICDKGFFDGQPCTTDSFCQQVPADKWPPCVCWQFCGYAGKWDCDSWSVTITIAESTDGNYCDVNINNGFHHLIGKPNDPPPRTPLDKPTEQIELTKEGLNFTTSSSGSPFLYHCTATE